MSRTAERKYNIGKISYSKSAFWEPVTPSIKWPYISCKTILLWCSFLFFLSVIFDSSTMVDSRLKRYLRSLKWTPMPVAIGFGLIGYLQYKHTCRREAKKISTLNPCDSLATVWEVEAYKLLPLRAISRTWGWMTGVQLPEWSRKTLLGSYVKAFGCNMEEAEIEDITEYRCLSELFKRKLKTHTRPIDGICGVVSPADGTVLSKGKVTCGLIEQIKGVSYSAKRFLGPNCWSENGPTIMDRNDDECFHNSLLKNPSKNDLYHVVIYLAPGDYHRFHSPSEWTVYFRRHFPGELLSVNPSIASWIKDLFVINERVSYMGSWECGFFSMTAVGATNVGSIVVPFDSDLKTNAWFKEYNKFYDVYFDKEEITMKKGQDFGEFNLGSTIVLLFEAPKNYDISVETGQKVLVGQPLIRCIKDYNSAKKKK